MVDHYTVSVFEPVKMDVWAAEMRPLYDRMVGDGRMMASGVVTAHPSRFRRLRRPYGHDGDQWPGKDFPKSYHAVLVSRRFGGDKGLGETLVSNSHSATAEFHEPLGPQVYDAHWFTGKRKTRWATGHTSFSIGHIKDGGESEPRLHGFLAFFGKDAKELCTKALLYINATAGLERVEEGATSTRRSAPWSASHQLDAYQHVLRGGGHQTARQVAMQQSLDQQVMEMARQKINAQMRVAQEKLMMQMAVAPPKSISYDEVKRMLAAGQTVPDDVLKRLLYGEDGGK